MTLAPEPATLKAAPPSLDVVRLGVLALFTTFPTDRALAGWNPGLNIGTADGWPVPACGEEQQDVPEEAAKVYQGWACHYLTARFSPLEESWGGRR